MFRQWLTNPAKPKYFRDAGHFWGIAPGTPANIVRERVGGVDKVLSSAKRLLDEKGVDEIAASRGKVLFCREDVQRCMEFQETMKDRFSKELGILDPEFAKPA